MKKLHIAAVSVKAAHQTEKGSNIFLSHIGLPSISDGQPEIVSWKQDLAHVIHLLELLTDGSKHTAIALRCNP